MSVAKVLEELRTAISKFVELDDDGLIEVWDRVVVFRVDRMERDLWATRTLAGNPPDAWLLMIRRGRDPVYELLWRPTPGIPLEKCPVVGLSKQGDATVVAANLEDWLDALLYTGGTAGGGAEDDLESAREEAAREAVRVADDIADEMDRDLPDLETLGERWEEAQEKWSDAWADAVEGLD
jgi:hypothetical protein